jgi:hypothetical protein
MTCFVTPFAGVVDASSCMGINTIFFPSLKKIANSFPIFILGIDIKLPESPQDYTAGVHIHHIHVSFPDRERNSTNLVTCVPTARLIHQILYGDRWHGYFSIFSPTFTTIAFDTMFLPLPLSMMTSQTFR